MIPRVFLLLCLLALSTQAKRPNVLFIAIDDLNTRLGCYGFDHIVSPHIDKLARQGVRFDRAYCQYPSCGPSRTSVMTGLRPNTTGVLSNHAFFRNFVPHAVTLPQLFMQNGYYVARVGKIYHQANPPHIGRSGPDDPASWQHVVNPRGRDKDEEHLLTVYTPQLPLPDQMCFLKAEGTDAEQTDGKVVDETIKLLEEHKDEPFFIAAGLYRPHIPYIAPKKYFGFYDIDKTPLSPLPENYRETVPSASLASTSQWPNFGTTEREARECILAYDACVSFVDVQIGRLMAAVDRLGLRGNTIVVLWGDHGYHLGEHGLWRKNSLFEESARAPLIIDAPGIEPGTSDCKRIVEFVDIYPTLAELAGLTRPENLDGVSLVKLLKNPKAEWNRPAFIQTKFRTAPGYSVRTPRWRYVEWGAHGGDQGVELYDQENDPLEMNNLAGVKQHAGTMARLKKLIQGNWGN
ncbi:MAG: iduronate-2-sulfatase [Verrucomicrobiales bacterium]|nr:iduronate-2-sulfatase [Verrucomicrobiales bacterium]|tara:strand:- start:3270 stop:4655 length:1386 start_codon:yes stop_codon:yes gene_type:complete